MDLSVVGTLICLNTLYKFLKMRNLSAIWWGKVKCVPAGAWFYVVVVKQKAIKMISTFKIKI